MRSGWNGSGEGKLAAWSGLPRLHDLELAPLRLGRRTIDLVLLAHLLRLPSGARLQEAVRAERIISKRAGLDCAVGGRFAIVVGKGRRGVHVIGLASAAPTSNMESEQEHGRLLLHGEEIASVAAGSEHWLALTAGGLL